MAGHGTERERRTLGRVEVVDAGEDAHVQEHLVGEALEAEARQLDLVRVEVRSEGEGQVEGDDATRMPAQMKESARMKVRVRG